MRAFVLGSAVVEVAEQAFGHDPGNVFAAEYGDYIATSNGVYACETARQPAGSRPIRQYPGARQWGSHGDYRLAGVGSAIKVNSFWTFQRLLEMTEMSLCACGGPAYWFIERGQTGTMAPTEIWWGRPDRVRVLPHPTKYISGFVYDGPNGSEIPFLPSELSGCDYQTR